MKKIQLVVLLFFGSSFVFSQSILDVKPTIKKGQMLGLLLEQVEKEYPVKFYFLNDWFSSITIEKEYTNLSLRLILNELFIGTEFTFIEFNSKSVVFS